MYDVSTVLVHILLLFVVADDWTITGIQVREEA